LLLVYSVTNSYKIFSNWFNRVLDIAVDRFHIYSVKYQQAFFLKIPVDKFNELSDHHDIDNIPIHHMAQDICDSCIVVQHYLKKDASMVSLYSPG
jgi:hypothetical protein